jgi:hypothetical protein
MLLALGVLAGCGGGDNDDAGGTSGADVDQLLDDTFSNTDEIKSGRIELSARLEGPNTVTAELSGPFESQGGGKLPKLDLDAAFEGGGQRLEAGITATGDEGFVSFQGTDYEVSGPVFQQFQAAYEEASKQSEQEGGTSLATLGIDPRNWLTDARNEGDSEVGGTETIKITGGVDVQKLLDDVNRVLEQARSLGLEDTGDLPEPLSEQQKREFAAAVKDVRVEIHTGKDDRLLRRLVVAAEVATEDAGTLSARLDLSLLDVNEGQDIEAPDDARPFQELLDGLEELGLGAALGGGGGGSGGGGASSESLEEYSQCVQDAGGDTGKLRKCAELLTP